MVEQKKYHQQQQNRDPLIWDENEPIIFWRCFKHIFLSHRKKHTQTSICIHNTLTCSSHLILNVGFVLSCQFPRPWRLKKKIISKPLRDRSKSKHRRKKRTKKKQNKRNQARPIEWHKCGILCAHKHTSTS